jgi:hypothetical protein
MERHEWRNLKRRVTAALEGGMEDINERWEQNRNEVSYDIQDILSLFSNNKAFSRYPTVLCVC